MELLADDFLLENEMAKTFRIIDGDRIIKTINANMIPLTISDEFTTDQQKLILKMLLAKQSF